MENLKLLRKQKGISQLKLAGVLGVSRSTIAMWENGLSQPDHENLIKLSDYFNVTVDFLLGKKIIDNLLDPESITDKEKKLFELYQKAKESNNPKDNAIATAVEKLLGMDDS